MRRRYLVLITAFVLLSVGWILLSNNQTNAQEDSDQISLEELEALPQTIMVTINQGNGNDIGLFNIQTGQIELIIASDGDDSHATWSPDGSKVALQTQRDGQWEIYVYDVESQTELNITDATTNEMYPNWTVDGQVVHMSDSSGAPALYLTDIETLEREELTESDDCRPDYHPNVSWVNEEMAYRADCDGSGDIWYLDFETDERVNLTADSLSTDRYPAWSPDGEKILFVSHRDGNQEIYVMDRDGSNVTNLSQHEATDAQGSWSPNGNYIVFISDRSGTSQLWIMDTDGGRQTRLSNDDFVYNWPWWEPMPTQEGDMNEMSNQADANVDFVRATQSADGTWRFEVTVSHPDTGWEDYADGWDVVLPDGTILKVNDDPFTRLLLHPHENEQPFTRSRGGLTIPDDVTTVTVRAHDIVDGFGGVEVVVDLTTDSGENYEVIRNN